MSVGFSCLWWFLCQGHCPFPRPEAHPRVCGKRTTPTRNAAQMQTQRRCGAPADNSMNWDLGQGGCPSLGQGCCPETTAPTSWPLCPSLAEKTGKILTEFLRFYEDQYGVALFNSMRHEIEGTGAPQAQLLWRKVRGAGPGAGRPPWPLFPIVAGWSLRAAPGF